MTTMEQTTPLFTEEQLIEVMAASERLHKAADMLLMSAECDTRGSHESASKLFGSYKRKLVEAVQTVPDVGEADA